jgi:acetyltransferase-like isoleucine patch superfamily enzyme
VTIGEGSIVGAKSVVKSDIPPFTIAAGNPARVIRQISSEDRTSYAAAFQR